MCGRFTITTEIEQVRQEYKIDKVVNEFKPNYNVAPTQAVPVILKDENKVVLDTFKWGLIPHWAKDKSIGYKLINARAETVAEKPSFRSAFKSRRCLILTDGFYEWMRKGGEKLPHYIYLKSRKVFAMAGIWEEWQGIKTCSILTIEANSFMSKLHNRMPVILPKKNEMGWIDEHTVEDLKKFLRSYKSSDMKEHLVSTQMNNARYNQLDCIKAV